MRLSTLPPKPEEASQTTYSLPERYAIGICLGRQHRSPIGFYESVVEIKGLG
jgi:hypothetical protein